ncbi:hypothetical protein Syun_020600 [Stephania yunnanensis]|uniref:Endonuclease/exonuclease/phosphatase domain-containing protein n=1 Tax=Stephania yunnanensis TaxID=152371 RepID=A0AAP0IE74_9MAGN
MKVSLSQSISFLFFAVYGSPNVVVRRQLWGFLSELSFSSNTPWVLAGDFNALFCSEENVGGIKPVVIYKKFRDFVEREGLSKMKCMGLKFTWVRRQCHEVLDHVLVNLMWFRQFSLVVVEHLPRLHSDHSPLYFQVQGCSVVPAGCKCFRCQTA